MWLESQRTPSRPTDVALLGDLEQPPNVANHHARTRLRAKLADEDRQTSVVGVDKVVLEFALAVVRMRLVNHVVARQAHRDGAADVSTVVYPRDHYDGMVRVRRLLNGFDHL